MSLKADRYQDRPGRRCTECGRPALTSVRGQNPRQVAHHPVCASCWRDLLNANRRIRTRVRPDLNETAPFKALDSRAQPVRGWLP